LATTKRKPLIKPKTKGKKRSKKSFYKKLILQWFIRLIAGYVLFSICWVLLYRFVNPAFIPLHWVRAKQGYATIDTGKEWIDLEDFGKNMPHAVMVAEDQAFFTHHGFDFYAIYVAAKSNIERESLAGGSTISQQTAKNVFLFPNRTIWRKMFEAYYTCLIELFWGKKRILEVYLNVIETGKGIYGIPAIAKRTYGIDPRYLSKQQAINIAAIIPSPLKDQPEHMRSRATRHKRDIERQWSRISFISVN